jgi:hypothetical protein
MRQAVMTGAVILALAAGAASAQGVASPPAQASVTVGGKTLTIRYSAPSVRGRQIFGPGGVVSKDPTYPVWRAGANAATMFHTDANLMVGTLAVPRGDYTLYVDVSNPDAWTLVVNKQTGQWGLTYDKSQDLGRVKMTMSRPPAPIERLKYTLAQQGTAAVTLRLEWEQHIATVPVTLE